MMYIWRIPMPIRIYKMKMSVRPLPVISMRFGPNNSVVNWNVNMTWMVAWTIPRLVVLLQKVVQQRQSWQMDGIRWGLMVRPMRQEVLVSMCHQDREVPVDRVPNHWRLWQRVCQKVPAEEGTTEITIAIKIPFVSPTYQKIRQNPNCWICFNDLDASVVSIWQRIRKLCNRVALPLYPLSIGKMPPVPWRNCKDLVMIT
mmetsp:Transcript_24042/g.23091  ORF Transcript_24042/g.23091 Transcript_24042/m.23091 type:complete len:200 (-) Transcript_24042:122-721(-)